VPTPFTLIDSVETKDGLLALRQRRDEWMVTIAGRVLMSSSLHRSEDAVAKLGVAPIADRRSPQVLIGGLGLGFTLRAALDALPKDARVVVAELNARVVDWCRGPVAPSIGRAVEDRRVRVEVADVMDVVGRLRGLDAIIVDLYEGPRQLPPGVPDALYGSRAIEAIRESLAPDGVYAVWSEEPCPPFEARLRRAGFGVERVHAGRGGARHAVYVARLGAVRERSARARSPREPARRK